ncbi:MAG: M1 family aminopeptidase [Candidatus Acidiferrales bacterium]
MKILLGAVALLLIASASARAQTPRAGAFRATHYEIEATLRPTDQTLTAKAKVTFVATSASHEVQVELHQDLKVASVTAAGNAKSLPFDRDNKNPLDLIVNIPDAIAPTREVTLTFDYSGPLNNEDDSPTPGIRFASIDAKAAYLLLPARWFPLTDFPSNRYTATFKIIVPDSFAVVGTGKSSTPSMVPGAAGGGQVAYTFTTDRPEPAGTFVAGNIQLAPVRAEGMEISVYTPPGQATTATNYAQDAAQIESFFSGEFGPLPDPNLILAQLPDGSLPSYSAPGLILISAHQWTPKPNSRLLAQLLAGQWWGNQVLPATLSDSWLSDGLARYSEALYAEHTGGVAGLHRSLEDFAVGALMYDTAAPIAQAQRLGDYSEEYRSVVTNKGAMVFHMLRTTMGNQPFQSTLRDYYSKFSGKSATIDDFEKIAESKLPPAGTSDAPVNLTAFFSQWLNSTGIPEFKIEFIVYRVKAGFKVIGKVMQDLETFHMPVEVRVETEGNPEFKTLNVVGTSSSFEVDTFGRPKPNGITLDPNNNLLKSSPRLRIRAAVARGEGLAEQGKYFEAIQEYQKALDIQGNNSLAHFRMAEAMFYQKNYQAAANEFRGAIDGDLDPSYKWVEVWSHIYLGKIFDLTGQRERAVNEYSKAQEIKDDTGGAQEEAGRYLQKPVQLETAPASKSG